MGVVHRDLKPENIVLIPQKSGSPQVKVLDFGIAKIMDAPTLTGSQQIFGTPGYIAPEYIQDARIDGRADLYSLGVILYEAATLALPFDYEYPGDLLVKHVTEPPVPLSARADDIPVPIEELILRCLAKTPDERFRDAHHFLDEVAAVRERISGGDASWGDLDRGRRDRRLEQTQPSGGAARDAVDSNQLTVERPAVSPPLPDVASAPVATPLRSPTNDVRESEPSRTSFVGERTAIEGGAGVPPVSSVASPAPLSPRPSRPVRRPSLEATLIGPSVSQTSVPDPPRPDLTDTIVEPMSFGPQDLARVIPAAPNAAAISIEIDLPPEVEVPRTSDSAEELGILGIRRWRVRFEALDMLLSFGVAGRETPPAVAESMAVAREALHEAERLAEEAVARQAQLEELTVEARRVLASFGSRQDEIARELSQARGKVRIVSARLEAAAAEHEAAAEAERRGGDRSSAPALRREIRDLEDQAQVGARLVEALEGQLREAQAEMNAWIDENDTEHGRLRAETQSDIAMLDILLGRLRLPLDRVESFVRTA